MPTMCNAKMFAHSDEPTASYHFSFGGGSESQGAKWKVNIGLHIHQVDRNLILNKNLGCSVTVGYVKR